MIELGTPVEELTRVGKSTASRLHRLGIHTARDLLFHFPSRYEDWSRLATISEIQPNQNISIKGTVATIKNFRSPRKRMQLTEALVEDETGSVKVLWFNQPFLVKNFPPGTKVSLSGKAEVSGREVLLKSPKYEILGEDEETKFTGRIISVYPLSMNLTQKQVQFLVSHVLPLAADLTDPLPEWLREQEKLPHLSTAIRWIHEPQTMEQAEAARKRFGFDELFYLQLQSAYFKQLNNKESAEPLRFFEQEIKEFVAGLPYELTAAQKKTAWGIFLDLQKEFPMNRLVQGDVGSGKTVVAAMAMYNVALNGKQSSLMAPTEVLATQHFFGLTELFRERDIPLAILTRTKQAVAVKGEVEYLSKKDLLGRMAAGECAIVIGTHALLQSDVHFKDLALAVVDEQHRFGVQQRKRLRSLSGNPETIPHLLSMTATPIPRTLSLVFYGDLEVSSIREMPKNRLPIQTSLIPSSQRNQAYEFIRKLLKEERQQVYVVCPLIEESDSLGVKSVSEETEALKKIFPEFTIASLHGQMKSSEKDEIMENFKNGKTDILVSTTVIEVGVDVPNATVMVIEGAERFGLSQLHQIRGRVGRSDKQSYCFLFPPDETSSVLGRLQRFIQCSDGFQVAELDLQIRGAGEMLGTKQSGVVEFRFVDLSDTAFVEHVRQTVDNFLEKYSLDEFPLLRQKIEEMNEKVHLE